MKQYNSIKAKYPDALLLFRVGDFYETFGADAIKTSEILGIVLTARNNGASKIELAGFPHHALDTYLPKLVRAGQRVAICDQLEDPSKTKKIVKRGVTELVTPGVSLNDQVLDHRSNNFLAALHFTKKNIGVAFLDISTGEFLTTQGSAEYIDKLLQSFAPTEVIFQRQFRQKFEELFGTSFYTFMLEDWVFNEDYAREKLLAHFGTASLKGFGVEDLHEGIVAAGAALQYLYDTAHNDIGHITKINRIEEDKYVWLDRFTIRNLELLYSPNENATTLLDILDKTITPMGSRMMRRWLTLPLKNITEINRRLGIVDFFLHNEEQRENFRQHIKEIGDLERILSKVATQRVNPRELLQLKNALQAIEPIKLAAQNSDNEYLQIIGEKLNPCNWLSDKIENEINPEAPVNLLKGNVIKQGVNEELDELRQIITSGKDALIEVQQREIEKTGIPSLKIGYNNVFGYYIEVRN
ncbi:MAG TPA: DNA mismatch repair protein MutS, partial [Flavobacteriales bacterium]|nr:DNA mismatch repair protein MutS [Flavobacteriales bacterium]